MCVSNPDLHRYIVEEAWEGGDYLALGEVDGRNFCRCKKCLAWDQPQTDDIPDSVRRLYGTAARPVVSDRYARFWKTIQEMAAKRNPKVTVTTYLYVNSLPAPRSDIQLNSSIYGEFAPWSGLLSYYPMPDEEDRWLRAQWKGWRDRGIRLVYRPNMLHGGYVMPHISTRQAGKFFKFAYEHGMEGFMFDSLHAHWGTKGPMLYMYMRLAWDPAAVEIGQIRREYFSAFGPAAEHVKRYFDYWEEYSYSSGTSSFNRPGGQYNLYNPVGAYAAYPPEALARGEAFLNEALQAAREHPSREYARRVEFLKAGLEHARLSARFMGATDGGRVPTDDPERLLKLWQALRELVEFRKAHEHLYISDLLNASAREIRRVDFESLMQTRGAGATTLPESK